MKPFFHGAVGNESSPLLALAKPAQAALHVGPAHSAHHDTLAWSLLGVLALTLCLVGACGWGIYRHFRRTTPKQQLLDELKEHLRNSQATTAPGPAALAAPAPPWEKPDDWWKNPPVD